MGLKNKAKTQIEVCKTTYAGVNCSKGIEYCKICGATKTRLLSITDAEAALNEAYNCAPELCDIKLSLEKEIQQLKEALSIRIELLNKAEAKVEAAKQILKDFKDKRTPSWRAIELLEEVLGETT